MNPFSEYLHLFTKDLKRVWPGLIIALLAGLFTGHIVIGGLIVVISVYIYSRLYKAEGHSGFWFGKPIRSYMAALIVITFLILTTISFLLGGFARLTWFGIYPDLAFWLGMEDLPLLLFAGLVALFWFLLSSTGSGLLRTLGEFAVGYLLLLLVGMVFMHNTVFRFPQDTTADFILTVLWVVILVAAVVFRYCRRFLTWQYCAGTLAAVFIMMKVCENLKFDHKEEITLLPALEASIENNQVVTIDPGPLKENQFVKLYSHEDILLHNQIEATTRKMIKISDEQPGEDRTFTVEVKPENNGYVGHLHYFDSSPVGKIEAGKDVRRITDGTTLFRVSKDGWLGYLCKKQQFRPKLNHNPASRKYRAQFDRLYSSVLKEPSAIVMRNAVGHFKPGTEDWTLHIVAHQPTGQRRVVVPVENE